jgi:hypothetical protein
MTFYLLKLPRPLEASGGQNKECDNQSIFILSTKWIVHFFKFGTENDVKIVINQKWKNSPTRINA